MIKVSRYFFAPLQYLCNHERGVGGENAVDFYTCPNCKNELVLADEKTCSFCGVPSPNISDLLEHPSERLIYYSQ